MSAGIVVGYDGSDTAKAALRVAIEVGRAYGEKVVIAFGYEVNPVVGTRGESPLRGAWLGSTPHKLLQLTDRPVLVVQVAMETR
jgi:nucleotide-binding universal stress UspA family protein